MTGPTNRHMVEPVGSSARLVVSPTARYTEVAGLAVVVLTDTAEVVQLRDDVANWAARLDGRPLAEVFTAELASNRGSPPRFLLEALRRLKVLGVIEDLPSGEEERPCDWAEPTPIAPKVSIAGWMTADPTVLHLGSSAPPAERSDPDDARSTLETTARRRTVQLTRGDRPAPDRQIHADGVPIDRFALGAPDAARAPDTRTDGDDAHPGAIDTFVALVGATEPRTQLDTTGVVDLLAIAAGSCSAVRQRRS